MGVTISQEKTKGLLTGKSKDKSPSLNDISWTKYVKTLGVCYGYNMKTDHICRDKFIK